MFEIPKARKTKRFGNKVFKWSEFEEKKGFELKKNNTTTVT